MNSREHSDMPPAPSYPSPNAAQMGQGTMQYYSNRQLTEDELLSAELSRDASGPGLADASGNGVHHGQSMVLGSTGPDLGRPASADQHHHDQMLPFTPSQQVGVDPNHDLSYGDQSSRRKRSKISRACDECRRKKVRCDASSESGVDACSNCRRLGVTCQFTRVPMKRGPSKGYIKELAERLNTLESQMQPAVTNPEMQYQPMGEVSSPHNYQDFSPPAETAPISRKRTYSDFEGLPSASFAQPSFASRPNALAPQVPPDHSNPATMHDTAPISGNLFWNAADEHVLPGGVDIGFKQPMDEDMTPLDVDGASFKAYHDKIHPSIPILPQSKERLLELMHQCPREVQEVFLYALYTLTHTKMDRVANTFEKVPTFSAAQDLLLFHARNPAEASSTSVQIISFQSMLLMALYADTRGPDNLLNKDGIPKHTLLQTFGKLAFDLAKRFGQVTRRVAAPESDADADANIIRRCWVSFVILSRWYAISNGDASSMRFEQIHGCWDGKVFGRGHLTVASFSTFFVDLIEVVIHQPNICQTRTGFGRVVGNNILASLDRLNYHHADMLAIMSEEEAAKHPYLESLTAQLYWTIQLLMKRHIFVWSPYEVIYSAISLIDEIYKATMQDRLTTPFDFHSLALAAVTLLEACVIPDFADECWESLNKLDDLLEHRLVRSTSGVEFDDILGTPGWDRLFRQYIDSGRPKVQESQIQDATLNRRSSNTAPPMGPNEQRSLQHLADLAVGAEGSVTANASPPPENPANATSPRHGPASMQGKVIVDFTKLTSKGYLNVFVGLISRHSG